ALPVRGDRLTSICFQVARSENQVEKPRNQNRQASANVGRVMHIASAKETTKFCHVMRDKPASVGGCVDRCGSVPTVGKACESDRQRERGNDRKRPGQRSSHQ